MPSRLDSYLNNFTWQWEDDIHGSSLSLPLFLIQIIQQKDKSYRIRIGSYEHPKHLRNLSRAKQRAAELCQELIQVTEIHLSSRELIPLEDPRESELRSWKSLLFYDQ